MSGHLFRITPHVLKQIVSEDDPVGRQFLPSENELQIEAEELSDPIGDNPHTPVKGIVHRHPDRCLFLPILSCPVYCRFCFRKERVGTERGLSRREIEEALCYIQREEQIREVIFSGGDPLMMRPHFLLELMQRLDKMSHVKVIRFHSRVPVVDPDRVTTELLAALRTKAIVYIAIHSNHAQEWSSKAFEAVRKMRKEQMICLGQTVLLKGVNNSVDALFDLFTLMVEQGIKPYYLHHPDLAKGTSHFRLTIEEGQRLYLDLRKRVSGLAMPTYVLDIPGGHGKVPINCSHVKRLADSSYEVMDCSGVTFPYPPSPDHR